MQKFADIFGEPTEILARAMSEEMDVENPQEERKAPNYWFDPDDVSGMFSGPHTFHLKETEFTVDRKYTPVKILGQGAYGTVISARDNLHNMKIAIKKMKDAFVDAVDAKRILRELKLLRHFRHENVVGILDLIPPAEQMPLNDVYVAMELVDSDLHKVIYSRNRLTDGHIQYFLYQILRGMNYIHSANVIHRDLKPANLLVDANCRLKICDFGLARGIDDREDKEDKKYFTEYVCTRWYRAPEIMCASEYDSKVDVWSIGCIFAELHARKPLFAGDDYLEQMTLIFDVIGTPSEDDLKFLTNPDALTWIRSLERTPKIPWAQLYPNANPLALDLIDKMLKFDPNQRISVAEALAHPYFASLRHERTEIKCRRAFDFSFERQDLSSRRKLRELVWEEICLFRPHLHNHPGVRKRASSARSTRKESKKSTRKDDTRMET
jgi:mitogen-activated protein kinase 1/3